MGLGKEKALPSETSMQRSTQEIARAERLGWIIDQLLLAAVAKGQVFMPERLRANAEDLVDIPQDALAAAFSRARRELDYPPGVSEIRRLAMADEGSKLDAEMRSSWDLTIRFADKYVGNDVHGNYGPEHGWYGAQYDREGNVKRPATYPQLEQRVLDVVRRTGGWKQYKCMTEDDQPFQQKRFFEEYRAWAAVEHVADSSTLLPMPAVRQLAGNESKVLGGVGQRTRSKSLEVSGQPPTSKERLPKVERSDEWYAERRAKLKQMADELLAKRSK